MTDREQLESLVRDMETMKSSIRRNRGLIRQMLMGGGLGTLSLAVGLATTGFGILAHFLAAECGGFMNIPAALRIGLFAYIALVCASGILLKFAFIARRSKELESGIGVWQFVRVFYSDSMLHVTVASVVLMAGGSVLAALSGHPWLAVPIVACLAVVPINAVADVAGLPEYSVTGYASLAGGIASYFLLDRAPFLALALASAALYFSFAVGSAVAWKRWGRK